MAIEIYKSKWPLKPLSEVAEINPSRPPALRNLSDDTPVSFVPMASVCEKVGEIKERIIRPFAEVKKGFTYFANGDVIFAKITPCMENGKSAVASDLENGLAFGSTEFHVLRPRSSPAEWLYYFVRSRTFRSEAARHFKGSAGQQRVPEDFLVHALIPDPPLKDRATVVARIKECLGRVEEMQRLREEVKTESDFLEPSVVNDFLGSITVRKAPLVALGNVLKRVQYGTSQKANADASATPMLRMGNIQQGRVVATNGLKYAKLSAQDLSAYRLNEGDILFNRTNSFELVGKSGVFTGLHGDWVFASYLIRLIVDRERVLPEFVSTLINSSLGRSFIEANARRAIGQVNVNAKQIARFEIPALSLAEQKSFVDKLTDIRQASDQIAEESTETEFIHLRESILREAFAGNL